MSKYTTILFDADQTLLDFNLAEAFAVSDCLDFFGLPNTKEHIKKFSSINQSFWEMLERKEIKKQDLLGGRWVAYCKHYGINEDAEKLNDKFMEYLGTKNHLIEGAEDVCSRLYGKCKLYIITNGTLKIQEKRLYTSVIYKYFEHSFISESIGFNKPQVEFFDYVKNHIKDFDPQKTLIVGDSLGADIRGGINAGIDTCWFNPQNKQAPQNMSITCQITKLSQLESVILCGN